MQLLMKSSAKEVLLEYFWGVEGEIWFGGERFPHKEGVLVLPVALVTVLLQQQQQILQQSNFQQEKILQ